MGGFNQPKCLGEQCSRWSGVDCDTPIEALRTLDTSTRETRRQIICGQVVAILGSEISNDEITCAVLDERLPAEVDEVVIPT